MSQMSFFLLAIGLLVAAGPATAAAPAADPMRPSYVPPVRLADRHRGQRFALQAVFGDQQRRVAVMNGQVVQPGDRVQGALVAILAVSPGVVRKTSSCTRWSREI